jgi:hypothetical protein
MSFHIYMIVKLLILSYATNSISHPLFLTNKIKNNYYKIKLYNLK